MQLYCVKYLLMIFYANVLHESHLLMTTPRNLSTVLDAALREGKLNLRTEDLLAALPGVSPQALRQSLHRQQLKGKVVRVSRGSELWLLVPPQYAVSGAPPLETWLDRFLSKTLQSPYYVGLLSAAETYGASPYAVMVTQVMVPAVRRPITVGRHEVVFHVRNDVAAMPTRWHETAEGRFKVSTAELTALDLVQRAAQVGGIARVQEVLRPLAASCSAPGLLQALEAAHEVPSAQRLGVLLSQAGNAQLAQSIRDWLAGQRTRTIELESGQSATGLGEVDRDFNVRRSPITQSANA
jgi:predicted transcriptional regulator of viral defense system